PGGSWEGALIVPPRARSLLVRASTLFALTLSILVGLGVAIAAKMAGYFNPPPGPAAPVAEAPKKFKEVTVLAAGRNLFAGDVMLTSNVDGAGVGSSTRTACIVPRVRVIAKRNTLWPVFAPLADDKPVAYTLEVNPYRAALMEYARGKGQIILSPLPATDQRK